MDPSFLATFVEVRVTQAANGFRSVRVETIKYRPPTFDILVRFEGRQECLVLHQSEVEDAISNNGLVLKLERVLLKAGAPR